MNTLQRSALVAACAAALLSRSAHAQYECYDFSGLASDSKYTVGDVCQSVLRTVPGTCGECPLGGRGRRR